MKVAAPNSPNVSGDCRLLFVASYEGRLVNRSESERFTKRPYIRNPQSVILRQPLADCAAIRPHNDGAAPHVSARAPSSRKIP